MKPHVFAIVAAGLLLSAAAAQEDAAKKELQKLKGTWTVVSAEREGKAFKIEGDKFTFADGKVTIKTRDRADDFTCKLDPTATPMIIDLIPTDEKRKGEAMEGIYKLDGDELKICVFRPGGVKERPAEFATKPGSNRILVVLKRDKP
jgi:uncharacterized protein (TIGR03067 family)